jgi:hypothetical protein
MVFIIYARDDASAVNNLERSLKEQGLAVLRDQEILEGGDRWPAKLAAAIDEADSVLVIWSSAAAESDPVDSEVNQALALQKRVIPCTLDETDLPPHLRAINAVDLMQEHAVLRLCQRLVGRSKWLLKLVRAFLNTDMEHHTPASIAEKGPQNRGFEGFSDYTEGEIQGALEELVAERQIERVVCADGTVRYTFFD